MWLLLWMPLMAYGQLPAGFTQRKLADKLKEVIELVHAPDGRIFMAERSGNVKVYQNGTVSTVHTVATTTDDEQGLLGITLHPQFATNGKCYIFYTNPAKKYHYLDLITINGTNQVSSSERVMQFDSIKGGLHNGGALRFKDNLLYVAIGESSTPADAIDLNTYRGKILRLTEDGQPAPGNPYYNEAGASRQKRSIWAIGMRNPWKMALDPVSQKLFVVNVGGTYEEINDVTSPDPAKKYNYGWDSGQKSGPQQDANTIQPVFAYTGESWGCAITTGVFFNPPTTNYPAEYRNRFYFTDWCRPWLRSIDATNPGAGHREFSAESFYRILGTSVGIDGNIYYVKYHEGTLWRLEYNASQAPAITNQPESKSIVEGDAVTFSVTANGVNPLMYQWQKNGVSIAGATASTFSISQVKPADAANYRCVVTNSAGSITSAEAKLTVLPFNARPVPRILQPASSLTYNVDDMVQFAAEATDAEDGTLPASAFRWELRQFHKDDPTSEHWHPGPAIAPGIKSGSFKASNGGELSPNLWIRLLLTVTDSKGRTGTDSVDIYPNKVTLTANATVPGVRLVMAGEDVAPFSRELVVGATIDLKAPLQHSVGDSLYEFAGWSHGGAASQTLRVPGANTTYTASYQFKSTAQNPFLGAPVALPGKIEAENFDFGGKEIAYHDATTGNSGKQHRENDDVDIEGCADVSGGYNIGYVATGEWLEYTVDITTAGRYTLAARVANPGGAKSFHVELDGQTVSGAIAVPVTGGFQAWQTVSVTTPELSTGRKILRVVMDATDFNLNYLTFALVDQPASLEVAITAPTNNTEFSAHANITVQASVTAGPSTISRVEFFQGSTKLGEDATSPYEYTWSHVAAGTYSITAKATTTTGQSAVSIPVTITVKPEMGGRTNLALNKPTVVSSTENGSFPGQSAVDGKLNTRWSSQFSDPQWIYVDLGAVYALSEVKITWEDARGKDYQLQVANVVGEWNDVKSITNNTALVNTHTGLNATGRYVRIYGTKRHNQYGYSIFELEVYGSSSTGTRSASDHSTTEFADEKLFVLYPNPAQTIVTIKGLESDCICTIVHLGTGHQYKVQTVNQYLDVSNLQTGTYVIEFSSGNRLIRKRFIKQ
ncbi:coagulation factor 5/8 type domain protein [Fibrisoma limi BUZ 3]|uniref:Coagulation factor 5/8 type domain protein n=2 Tax=Fibrisoma limi TaxID=663275 RepID=I2GK21_9BACT|nr:coagulation factor 5/8 type domain protein [Fibrisoma limi BUZ 3]